MSRGAEAARLAAAQYGHDDFVHIGHIHPLFEEGMLCKARTAIPYFRAPRGLFDGDDDECGCDISEGGAADVNKHTNPDCTRKGQLDKGTVILIVDSTKYTRACVISVFETREYLAIDDDDLLMRFTPLAHHELTQTTTNPNDRAAILCQEQPLTIHPSSRVSVEWWKNCVSVIMASEALHTAFTGGSVYGGAPFDRTVVLWSRSKISEVFRWWRTTNAGQFDLMTRNRRITAKCVVVHVL